MGKRNIKALMSKKTTGQLYKLLDDDTNEAMNSTYDKKIKNKKLAMALRFKDTEIEKERTESRNRACPVCHIDGCGGNCDENMAFALKRIANKKSQAKKKIKEVEL